MRINKYLSQKKLASRREADLLIAAGKVLVNGQPGVVGQQIQAHDTVEVVGEQKPKRVIAYYKPRGVITHSPEEHEVDIATQVRIDHGLKKVFPVGRLDKDSEGLILLTDDGRITGPLLNPENGHEKEYEVTVDKEVTDSFLSKLRDGVSIEGYITKPARAEAKSPKRFLLTLTEGKKHQIRRMCAALGYQVQTLTRVRVLHINIENLKSGEIRHLKGESLATLYRTLDITK